MSVLDLDFVKFGYTSENLKLYIFPQMMGANHVSVFSPYKSVSGHQKKRRQH